MKKQVKEEKCRQARIALAGSDWDTATYYYKDVLKAFPNEWEPVFFVGMDKARKYPLTNLKLASRDIRDVFSKAIQLLDKDNEAVAADAIDLMSTYVQLTLATYYDQAFRTYSYASDEYARTVFNRHCYELSSCASLCGLHVENIHGKPELQKLCVELYKYAVDLECLVLNSMPERSIPYLRCSVDQNVKVIRKYCRSYENPLDKKKRETRYDRDLASASELKTAINKYIVTLIAFCGIIPLLAMVIMTEILGGLGQALGLLISGGLALILLINFVPRLVEDSKENKRIFQGYGVKNYEEMEALAGTDAAHTLYIRKAKVFSSDGFSSKKEYGNRFAKSKTEYIGIEVTLLPSECACDSALNWNIRKENGEMFSGDLISEFEFSYGTNQVWASYGWKTKGNWPVGKYVICVCVGSGPTKEVGFEITKD